MAVQTEERFGPNTEAVETLIEQIKNLTPEQALRVQEEFPRVPAEGVWMYASEVSNHNGRGDAIRPALAAARMSANEPLDEATRAIVYGECWDLVSNAVVALVAEGLLDQEDFDQLYGPWARVMEVQ
ncbi:MAG: hypothetical protein ACYCTG_00770 [Ferrimicrobium sp.]